MKSFGVLAAILSALCMGTMGVFSRKTGFDAEVITFFRLFIGALLLLVFLIFSKRVYLVWRWPTWPVLINGFMLAGFIIFYVEAMNHTTMANAIMVLYLSPLVASIYAHFFLGEHLTLISIVLILTALLGFGMMMEFKIDFSQDLAGEGRFDHAKGLGYAFVGLICYTAFMLINRVIDRQIHVNTKTFYQLSAGALFLSPFLIGNLPAATLTLWPWLLGVGMIPGFVGIYLAVYALEKLPAATFGTLAYFEPIFVVFLGWILYTEQLNLLQLAGCSLILISGTIKGFLETQGQKQRTS